MGGIKSASLVRGAEHVVCLSIGSRRCTSGERVDPERAALLMDPADRVEGGDFSAMKRAVSFTNYPRLDASAWKASGVDDAIVDLVRDGARVEWIEATPQAPEPVIEAGVSPAAPSGAVGVPSDYLPRRVLEIGQYAFKDDQHLHQAIWECDRAILAGHLEPVPPGQVDRALVIAPAHPWVVVRQGDKWRAAQDYSVYTNLRVGRVPFTLPSVWDAVKVVGPDSHFAKYDLRDGFWAIPVQRESRSCLMVRHPGTGRLLQCRSLPFGYALSPAVFCAVTEAVAQEMRRRVVGRGIHIYCYVDDYIVCGDDESLTLEGMETLETLLDELGLQWSLHKRRGPARAIEFLGLLIVNGEEMEGRPQVAVTEKRRAMMLEKIDGWMTRRGPPASPEAAVPKPYLAPARELAELLGLLVFASQCVPRGRVQMMGMLRAFAGLQVDWISGRVRYATGIPWSGVVLRDSFWRDLIWWRSALEARCCWRCPAEARRQATIMGTDASDKACGAVAWVDGSREEATLEFTRAERRRPITWRELRGAVRVVEVWGPRLAGHSLIVDIDNTGAVGAAEKLFSKSEDMMEQVRRMVELSDRFDLEIHPVHTPGVFLQRPDGLSRGDAAAPPRRRLSREACVALEARFGPFDEFIGAESEH